jgi:predicted transcriptional regulator
MSLRSEVLNLVQEEKDNDLLAAIRELLLRKDADWWETIGTAEKASIKRGIAQADAGKGIPHAEAMKPYGKWL